MAKRAKVQEQEDFEEVELDDDLFSTAGGSVGSSSRAEQRAEHVAAVLGRTAERVGTLRKVVQLSDSAADLEQLDSVLRAWRVAKHRVTNQTGQELVGECLRTRGALPWR